MKIKNCCWSPREKLLSIESQSNDLQSKLTLEKTLHDITKQQADSYKQQINQVDEQIKDAKAQLKESKQQLESVKNRGLFDRLFNR